MACKYIFRHIQAPLVWFEYQERISLPRNHADTFRQTQIMPLHWGSDAQSRSEAPLQKTLMELIQGWHKTFLWSSIMVVSKAWTISLIYKFTNSQPIASGLLITQTLQSIPSSPEAGGFSRKIFPFLFLFNKRDQVNSIKTHCKCAAFPQ